MTDRAKCHGVHLSICILRKKKKYTTGVHRVIGGGGGVKFWGWQCLNLAISVYSKFCHTDITKTFSPSSTLWTVGLVLTKCSCFVDRGSWAEYALVLGKVLYWRPYLDILYPSCKVLSFLDLSLPPLKVNLSSRWSPFGRYFSPSSFSPLPGKVSMYLPPY